VIPGGDHEKTARTEPEPIECTALTLAARPDIACRETATAEGEMDEAPIWRIAEDAPEPVDDFAHRDPAGRARHAASAASGRTVY
jgi:hypothetical protein